MQLQNQQLVVLTSPPASGKTFWIHQFAMGLFFTRILVISPLRALADECRQKWKQEIEVMTPEEWLGNKKHFDVVIFDEFHLWFYWGDSFRPLMWEMFYEISIYAQTVILLTATFSADFQNEVSHFQSQFDEIHWINCGNQSLKYKPFSYLKAPSAAFLIDQIETDQTQGVVKLIFCKYREEVLLREKRLKNLGYSVVSCIGGEAKFMQEKLKHCPRPDYIVSTTVLSHGVNLPEIEKIYFLYPVKNIDFWIQMVARGGRRGGKYSVFALEAPLGIYWNPVFNAIRVMWLMLKNKFSLVRFLEEMSLSE